jgi:hypothetical protein
MKRRTPPIWGRAPLSDCASTGLVALLVEGGLTAHLNAPAIVDADAGGGHDITDPDHIFHGIYPLVR